MKVCINIRDASYRYQWSQAIYEFLPSIPTHYIHHFANTKDHIGDDKITITSYDLLVRAINTFAKHIYGFVILVNIHIIFNKSNINVVVAIACCKFVGRIPRFEEQ